MTAALTITQVGDIQEIANRLAQHSRGVDRADETLLADCYHDDASVDYGFYAGPAGAFATILTDAQKAGPVTLHRTGQMWIRISGEKARSESYVIAYVQAPEADGAMKQRLVCGRYLDRHAKRDGSWRLDHRTYVLDTNVNWPGEHVAGGLNSLAHHVPAGGHGPADPGIALLALAAAKGRAETGDTSMNMADMYTREAADAVISRQQIADLTMAYCRGVDRADEALLASIFHSDSTVVSGAYNGNGQGFASEICQIVRTAFAQTFHSIANQWIDVTGDAAVGETYVIAIATTADGASQILTGGRYIDRFERREGRWKFAERTFVSDWSRVEPATEQIGEGIYAALTLRGKRDPQDPVYALWK
ncbi:nuclear transport factor 2 family protein [Sphingobium sp. SCG-1]|uniref:nuclear transport factor 2 family protein n=1 Tax=Sphingobium sp. SCG-1 TaxID=2072936 RepID=UPI000CD6A174|nr:nuclear transport factor 2 family protein [Sphingobium sp. SCG-1]AUW58913.1 nuclear transport factor 2 family protein [Sphingobium sp. SCG-1]